VKFNRAASEIASLEHVAKLVLDANRQLAEKELRGH
jgi:hypothetical protein